MKEERRFAIKECITGKEIQKVRKRCGLSRKELADLFKVSVRTVEYWENGKTPVSGIVGAVTWDAIAGVYGEIQCGAGKRPYQAPGYIIRAQGT